MEGGARSSRTAAPATRKRSLDEVVSPSFVAREDQGGAYDMVEMPKRYVHDYVAEEKDRYLLDPLMRFLELDNARITAMQTRVRSYVDAVIRKEEAAIAARAAAVAARADAAADDAAARAAAVALPSHR